MDPEVFALRYARQARRRAADCFENPVDSADVVVFDYFFWLILGAEPIVVDCGFDSRTSINSEIRVLADPIELLRRVGVEARKVRTLVVTHLHYDHVGCLDRFPSAEIFVQGAEVRHCVGAAMADPVLRKHYRADCVGALAKANFEGRVRHLDGCRELQGGISLHPVPGHTPGLQAVRISRGAASLVLASDAAHLAENLRLRNPFPGASDSEASREAFARLLDLAGGDATRIVPGHDPNLNLGGSSVERGCAIVRL